ncbi:MAG: FtsW/RodA/SpoVE family cell cycle protein [Odoribacter sp.]|nr:FtsW/RodA/SpoVE family cell cycle protein [Odoribacter sp.]
MEQIQNTATFTAADEKPIPGVAKPRVDTYIWGTYIALALVSVIELFSASSQEVQVDNIYGPIIRHAMFLVTGLLMMIAIQRTHFLKLYYLIPIFVLGSIAMMAMVLVGGTKINGVKRAITLGPVMILPAEFLKLAVALGIAWILSRSQIKVKGKHDVTNGGLIACTALVLLSSALLVNQGLTNTLLLMGISLGMMLIGGVSWRKLFYVVALYLFLGGCLAVYKVVSTHDVGPTQQDIELARINQTEVKSTANKDRSVTWKKRLERHFSLNKSADPITDENKQEQLSFIAQAHGGLTGVGIGNSRENARLPLAFSDYIYAIIVEELGALVAIGVLALYMFLMGRAGGLAMKFKSTLPCLLVIGCALVICLQALFHICIVVGVFPVSGQPLPLISKGGTSVIATSIALGVMLSASRWAARTDDGEETYRRELSSLPEEIANANPSNINK